MKRWGAWLAAWLLVGALTVPAAAAERGKSYQPQAEPAANVDADRNGIFDNLEQELAVAPKDARFDAIVRMEGPATDEALASLQGAAGTFAVQERWEHALNGFAARLTAGQIRALARAPGVRSVEANQPVHMLLDSATRWTGVQQARSDYGLTGVGVTVAIIDTGIDSAHLDLDGGKVIAFQDQVNHRTAAYDDNGHGTHVASIATGAGEASPAYRGVAPEASLVGIKVLNGSGSGTTANIISGIDWMIANRATYSIRIGNLSLGSTGCSDGTDSLSAAVDNASASGIAMFVAAGNSGPGRCSIGAPGAAASAITVGATADPGEGGWALASFSSRGLTADGRFKPDLVAPGVNITAAQAGTTRGYVTYSGTSMATPFAAGVGALVLQADPGLTVDGLKSILYHNVADWGPLGADEDYGRGPLLAYDAIREAAGGGGTFDTGLSHGRVFGSLSGRGQNSYWNFNVTDTSRPIAVTLLMGNVSCSWWSCSPDFDLYLISPSGAIVSRSEGTTRQEQILYRPTVTGTYRVRVYAYNGSGPFWLDTSYR